MWWTTSLTPRWCFYFWSLAAIHFQKSDTRTITFSLVTCRSMLVKSQFISRHKGHYIWPVRTLNVWTHTCVTWFHMYFILCLIPMWILFEVMGTRLGVRLETKLEMRLLCGRGMCSYPYMDDPPLPVPVGSPPWIIKSCEHTTRWYQCLALLLASPTHLQSERASEQLNVLTHSVNLTKLWN